MSASASEPVAGFVEARGADIFYTAQGPAAGVPVILIHGFGCDMSDWAAQLSPLLQHRSGGGGRSLRVITTDIRGHGRSTLHYHDRRRRSKPDNVTNDGEHAHCDTPALPPLDIPTMAADAAAVLRHLGAGPANPAIAVGHSLGGIVVAELAAAQPALVRGLVCVEPGYVPGGAAYLQLADAFSAAEHYPARVAAFFSALYPPAGTDDHDTVPAWMPEAHALRAWGVDPAVAAAIGSQLAGHLGGAAGTAAAWLRPRRTAAPRLLVDAGQGCGDVEERQQLPLRPGLDTVARIPGCHWIMKTQTARFNAALLGWLETSGVLDDA